MNFKTGDKVVVIAGKDKGKEGKIINVFALVCYEIELIVIAIC